MNTGRVCVCRLERPSEYNVRPPASTGGSLHRRASGTRSLALRPGRVPRDEGARSAAPRARGKRRVARRPGHRQRQLAASKVRLPAVCELQLVVAALRGDAEPAQAVQLARTVHPRLLIRTLSAHQLVHSSSPPDGAPAPCSRRQARRPRPPRPPPPPPRRRRHRPRPPPSLPRSGQRRLEAGPSMQQTLVARHGGLATAARPESCPGPQPLLRRIRPPNGE